MCCRLDSFHATTLFNILPIKSSFIVYAIVNVPAPIPKPTPLGPKFLP